MFSDPATAIMTMIMLCFGGVILMFVFLLRTGAARSDELRELLRRQQMALADIERQIMETSFALRRLSGTEDSRTASVTQPSRTAAGANAVRSDEDLSSMLDAAAKSGKKLELGSNPLPPLYAAPAPGEAYDPASDPHLFEDFFGVKGGQTQGDAAGRPGMAADKARTPLSIKLDD